MPSAVKTSHATVLVAFRDMIAALPEFTEETVWISDDPPASGEEIPNASRHKLWLCIYPLEGSPDGLKFIGGGENSLVEHTGATTIIYSVDRLSRKGQPVHALTRSDVGLLGVKRTLLIALHGQNLDDGSGGSLLTQPIECVHAERPRVNGQPFGDLALTWSLPFHWDLTP